jgi:hypothetical protein
VAIHASAIPKPASLALEVGQQIDGTNAVEEAAHDVILRAAIIVTDNVSQGTKFVCYNRVDGTITRQHHSAQPQHVHFVPAAITAKTFRRTAAAMHRP